MGAQYSKRERFVKAIGEIERWPVCAVGSMVGNSWGEGAVKGTPKERL